MKYKILYVIFIMTILSEKLFMVVGAFLLGYCLGYYSFEILKYKNRKEEIHEFFQRYSKKYGASNWLHYEKLVETKIAQDNFFGNDLSNEQKLLNDVTEILGKELKDCNISTYLSKKLMAICCDFSFKLNEWPKINWGCWSDVTWTFFKA